MVKKSWLFLLFLVSFISLAAEEETVTQAQKPPTHEELNLENCDQSDNVDFVRNPVFEDDEDSIFIHDWANKVHITTKEKTLENESAFFLQKCNLTEEDLDELERHLRQRKYIRDAKVKAEHDGRIKIETWDNWSLTPTINFGRKGGENNYTVGVKERNLLGLGIDTSIDYFSNAQRSGYSFNVGFPLYLENNIYANLRYIDSDDGQLYSVFVNKDFVSHDTKNAFRFGVIETNFEDTIFQNGDELVKYDHDLSFQEVEWGWLDHDNENDLLRYKVGMVNNNNDFTQNENYLSASGDLIPVPADRKFTYPWFGIEYQEKDFKELQNIYLINKTEDFNFGWFFDAKLGISDGSKQDSAWFFYNTHISKGISASEKSLMLFSFALEGEGYDGGDVRTLAKLRSEVFHRFNNKWGYYFKNVSSYSKHQYLDNPVALGGDTGLRGYPIQYQHGERSTLFSNEIRYYPQVNLYKVLEIGGVVFWDIGRAFGKSTVTNIEDAWLNSIGIGARFFANRSSESRVIHLDFAFPISDNDEVNGFEVRAETKYSF